MGLYLVKTDHSWSGEVEGRASCSVFPSLCGTEVHLVPCAGRHDPMHGGPKQQVWIIGGGSGVAIETYIGRTRSLVSLHLQ